MKLFEKLFRPRPPIRDRNALADFIDAQSAFIVQKGIYEYSRARAGHYAKVLFAEKEFAQSVEHARWRAYPLGLVWVGETIEGVLADQAGTQRRAILDQLTLVVLSVFDRYPVPARSAKRPGSKHVANSRIGSIWSAAMRPSA